MGSRALDPGKPAPAAAAPSCATTAGPASPSTAPPARPLKLTLKLGGRRPLQAGTRRVRAAALAAALACDACAGVLLDPVTAPACAHSFCRPCVNGWLDGGGGGCPACALEARARRDAGGGGDTPTAAKAGRRGVGGEWGGGLPTPDAAAPLGRAPYESGRLKADPSLAAITAAVFPWRGGGGGGFGTGPAAEPTAATLGELERRYWAAAAAAKAFAAGEKKQG
jgi:hypothetical protein